jgi:hypothetical protein
MSELTRHSAPQMDRKPRYHIEVANIRKNSMERLQVLLTEYNGNDLVHVAVVRDATGQHRVRGMKGTARYVSLNVRQLPALIAGLEDARRRAVAEGLLAGEGEAVSAPPVSQPATAAPAPSRSTGVRGVLFRDGTDLLRQLTGKPEDACRNLLGKWLKDAKDDASEVLRCIRAADEQQVAAPIPWIERAVRFKAGNDPFAGAI